MLGDVSTGARYADLYPYGLIRFLARPSITLT